MEAAPTHRAASSAWPDGTELVPFENLEGIVLLTATARGRNDRDTTGFFVLDTGAGYLALDADLARALDIADSSDSPTVVDLAPRPLPRFVIGRWTIDQVAPLLTVRMEAVRNATDRPVLGLLGHRPLRDRALWIDYPARLLALIPATGRQPSDRDSSREASRKLLLGVLSRQAVAVPFRLVGDGKVLVEGRVSAAARRSARLNLLVDTGSSKCVLFEEALGLLGSTRGLESLRGLIAPTLLGPGTAWLTRVDAIALVSSPPGAQARGVDVAVVQSRLSEVLSRATGETIHGLLGYSFLKRFRVGLDYPHRILWLDPVRGFRDDRPYEYSQIGLQLERLGKGVRVAAVAEGSPAARAGIAAGDVIVSLQGVSADTANVIRLTHMLEGPPGSRVTLQVRRGETERTYRIRRRRLL
ncbi:MAG TPA: PDZ domain-containing protein [Candidatus Eisenbacteria bacterium]|jgi:hypothetical protein